MIGLQHEVEGFLEPGILQQRLREVQLGSARDLPFHEQADDILAEGAGAVRRGERLLARRNLGRIHLQRAQPLHRARVSLHRERILRVDRPARLACFRPEQTVDQRRALAVAEEELRHRSDLSSLRLGQPVDLLIECFDAREPEGDQRGQRGEQESEAGVQQVLRFGTGEPGAQGHHIRTLSVSCRARRCK